VKYSRYIKQIFLGVLVVLLLVPFVSAESRLRSITMKDGTKVQGAIVGIEDGKYIVESPALGKLQLNQNDVVSIISSSGKTVEASSIVGSSREEAVVDIQSVQSKIMADPEIMADIQAIASDPEMVALVTDPDFMKAIQSRNMSAVKADPHTAQLMNNPRIKALIEKIQSQTLAQ